MKDVCVVRTFSLMFFQIILVISSPSSSATGFVTLIFPESTIVDFKKKERLFVRVILCSCVEKLFNFIF